MAASCPKCGAPIDKAVIAAQARDSRSAWKVIGGALLFLVVAMPIFRACAGTEMTTPKSMDESGDPPVLLSAVEDTTRPITARVEFANKIIALHPGTPEDAKARAFIKSSKGEIAKVENAERDAKAAQDKNRNVCRTNVANVVHKWTQDGAKVNSNWLSLDIDQKAVAAQNIECAIGGGGANIYNMYTGRRLARWSGQGTGFY